MQLAPANLVHETSTSTGNGNLSTSAVNGKQRISDAYGTGSTPNIFNYFISNRAAAEWERGTGHMSAVGTLVRDTVKEGTNGTSAVTFSAGTKDITVDVPAAEQVVYTLRNRLTNGSFWVNQRQLSSVGDDAYCYDRWYALTQTASIGVTFQHTIQNGWARAIRLTQSQASAQRFGLAQIIETRDCWDLRGSPVTLSGMAQCSASTTLRYAILEWTGTNDTVTSDVVNSWTNGTFTAGNFFNSTSLTVTATGSIALTANTPTAITELTATLGSSLGNVIVMFWTDSVQAQNVTLDLGMIQLEKGTVATNFEFRPYALEERLCYRFFWRMVAGGNNYVGIAQCYSTTQAVGFIGLPVTMFGVNPTGSKSAASDFITFSAAGGDTTLTALTFSAGSGNAMRYDLTVASGLVAGNATILRGGNSNATLDFSADL
ncbi:MAG: hypothetical protein E6G97_25970 [Alphaproteobacteria bacterium]|nr:MAG: hypothetical protein E6G97_25970 [Alphaproteobacteria bacterium]